jgi:hypothetical protein
MRKSVRPTGPIHASEVLDIPESGWIERPWSQRRDMEPGCEAFCDVASSQALACLARLEGCQPHKQRFVSNASVDAWVGEFNWGRAWCASRGGEFWAWAQGDGVKDARVEVAGSISMWDEDLAETFAQSLAAGAVDKPWP